jgi:alpha-mannosidase
MKHYDGFKFCAS